MADLSCDFVGVRSPNPFWLASAPPTDKAYNVNRAFEAGWGGVVWKTLGFDPPIVNVSSRYGAVQWNGQRVAGFNNIELITDRPLQVNLDEIRQVKRDWPDRAMVVSLMVPCDEDSWKRILPPVEDTGCDAVELNFGCPHGMSERGMGSAVGQVPGVHRDGRALGQAAHAPAVHRQADAEHRRHPQAGARRICRRRRRGVADQHDQLDHLDRPRPDGADPDRRRQGHARRLLRSGGAADRAEHGRRDRARSGHARQAALGDRRHRHLARRGEFIALGAGSVQVCTAAMHYGFRIVDDMIGGLASGWTARVTHASTTFRGRAIGNVTDWQFLNLNYEIKARIDQDKCIKCGCATSPARTPRHQAITKEKDGRRHFESSTPNASAAILCMHVCPVDNCITMQRVDNRPHADWTTHPNNPMRKAEA
jgi:dihydropyrimidine dehydrogenase (NAD+) subunit PreA